MLTNFLLLIILPLCGNRVGLHTGLSKLLIICTAFNIEMNSKIFLCSEHHKMLTWLILAAIKCFSGFDKNHQLDVWKKWFWPPSYISGHGHGDINTVYATERLLSNLRLFKFVFSFDFWTGFQKNTLSMLKVLLWFMTFSSYFLIKKCLIHFKINWHI